MTQTNYLGKIIQLIENKENEDSQKYKDSNLQFLAVFGVLFALDPRINTGISNLYSWMTIISLFLSVSGEMFLSKLNRGTLKHNHKIKEQGVLILTMDIYNLISCLVIAIILRFTPLDFGTEWIWILIVLILSGNILTIFSLYLYDVFIDNAFRNLDFPLILNAIKKLDVLCVSENDYMVNKSQFLEQISIDRKNVSKKKIEKIKEKLLELLTTLDIVEEIKMGNEPKLVFQGFD